MTLTGKAGAEAKEVTPSSSSGSCDRCVGNPVEFVVVDNQLHRTGSSAMSYTLFLCRNHISDFATPEQIAAADAERAKKQKQVQAARKKEKQAHYQTLCERAAQYYKELGVRQVLLVDSNDNWLLTTEKAALESKQQLINAGFKPKLITAGCFVDGKPTVIFRPWLFSM